MGLFSELAAEWDDIQNPFYPVEPDLLFQAAVAAGGSLKWTVQHADGASRTLTFVATKSHLLSSTSQGLFSVFIVPEEINGVAGARLRSAGRAGGPESLGEGVTSEFGAAVNGALIKMGKLSTRGEFTKPKATTQKKKPVATSGKNPFEPEGNQTSKPQAESLDLASSLAELAELYKAGALTDTEFSKAKKKLLG